MRNREKFFRAFKDIFKRIRRRINGWSHKWLSQDGKEVFVKDVLQAIPMYAMSIFVFPKTLCDEINKQVRAFFGEKAG